MTKRKCTAKIKKIPEIKKGRVSYDHPHKRELHEEVLAERLTHVGGNLVFIKPSLTRKAKSADCEWLGSEWEMKTLFSCKENKKDYRSSKGGLASIPQSHHRFVSRRRDRSVGARSSNFLSERS